MSETTPGEAGPGFPPPGSCDCHVHVIGPKSRYPLAAVRSYTPADAPAEVLRAMMDRVGVERAVIVQTSIFGTDNACMLDGLAALGGAARGVAVPGPEAPSGELGAMHALGVRGIRLNTVSSGTPSADVLSAQIRAAAEQCARQNWHLQIFAVPPIIEAVAPTLSQLPVPVVFDHFGMVRPEHGESEALRIISRLMEEGRAWVKLSGFYRIAADAFDPAIGALARRFVSANPEQAVWASDWPHTPPHKDQPADKHEETPYRDVDTRGLLYRLQDWFEPRQLRQILVDNPARLYDFA